MRQGLMTQTTHVCDGLQAIAETAGREISIYIPCWGHIVADIDNGPVVEIEWWETDEEVRVWSKVSDEPIVIRDSVTMRGDNRLAMAVVVAGAMLLELRAAPRRK